MNVAAVTSWPAAPPYSEEMYAMCNAGSIGLRPARGKWIVAVVTRNGTTFSRPLSWRLIRHWIDENGADSETVDAFKPIGDYTSVFDVFGVSDRGEASPQTNQTKTEQRVYFIQCGDTGPIKIGIAVDVKRRIAGLQTACPFPLRLLATASGGAKLEAEFHRQFAGDRLRGEWFLPTAELLQLVEAFR